MAPTNSPLVLPLLVASLACIGQAPEPAVGRFQMQSSAVPSAVTGLLYASKVVPKAGSGYELILVVPDSAPMAGPLADGLLQFVAAAPFAAGTYVSPADKRGPHSLPLSIGLGFGGYSIADSITNATLTLAENGDSLTGAFHLWWVGGGSPSVDSVWFRGVVSFPR